MKDNLNKHTASRYFLFTRVNPGIEDYNSLFKACNDIDAYFGYKSDRRGDKTILKGFFILRGVKTVACKLIKHFPNFLLFPVNRGYDFNLDNIGDQVVTVGEHPFVHIRKDLFKDQKQTLNWFLKEWF